MIVVVGDAFVDRDVEGTVERICPDSPAPVLDEACMWSRPGGAGLAAVLAARMAPATEEVTLVAAWCDDPAGQELASMLGEGGVAIRKLPSAGPTAEKIRLRSAGQTLLRLDRGGRTGAKPPLPPGVGALIEAASAVLVADYGRGVAAAEPLTDVLEACRGPVVWDPHRRGPKPAPGCRLVVPNVAEIAGSPAGNRLRELTARAREARAAWDAGGVAVTRGDKGALLVTADEPPLVVPPPEVHGGDTCGAGDCFAAAVTVNLAAGALPSEAVTDAVRQAARFVGDGGAHDLARSPRRRRTEDMASSSSAPGRDAGAVADRVRSKGGTVVAAGGCFDLLHAGHVSMLQAARSLGDCLIVCLNSDESVRRLKGPDRPLNHQADRAATLSALDCVDAVEIFDEDTPVNVLERIRPDVWVKGGDYDGRSLPEAAVLSAWGGQAVVLPYLPGRSTTALVERAAAPTR